ncbi:MAG: type II toxin-antitoxin system death-on-curing family toxin [Spirochaetales bacterium]
MIRFSKDKVELLHQLMAQETGGTVGVRDEGLLDSALEGIFQSFGGKELYPTKEEKGARLGYTLISNHAFLDGNKRIGMYVMLTFLEVNGIKLECSNEDIVEIGLGVASRRMDYEGLLSWVIDHEIKYN